MVFGLFEGQIPEIVDFCARIQMGPEKVENIDSLTFKKAQNHKFASRKPISQYGFGQKMG